MDALIATFHIDYRILVAQTVNFIIVFLVLWLFALKPLLRILDTRRQVIEKGVTDAKRFEEQLQRSKEEYQATMTEAKREAGKILEVAQKDAQEQKKEVIKKSKEEIEKLILEAKTQIQGEREEIIQHAQGELVTLMSLGMEKILEKKLSKEMDQTLIQNTLRELSKHPMSS